MALVAVAIASVVRFLHAGLLTQFGLLVSVTAVGGAVLAVLGDLVLLDQFDEKGATFGPTVVRLVMILASAAIWLLVALGLGCSPCGRRPHSATPIWFPVRRRGARASPGAGPEWSPSSGWRAL